jgi:hypothetical protein
LPTSSSGKLGRAGDGQTDFVLGSTVEAKDNRGQGVSLSGSYTAQLSSPAPVVSRSDYIVLGVSPFKQVSSHLRATLSINYLKQRRVPALSGFGFVGLQDWFVGAGISGTRGRHQEKELGGMLAVHIMRYMSFAHAIHTVSLGSYVRVGRAP